MTERELYDAYKLDVYHTAYYMLNKKEDAEDILQDVFIKAFQRDYRKIENVKPWLLSITMNECRNYLRKKSRIAFLSDLKMDPFLSTSKDVELLVESGEASEQLILIVSKLKPKIKEVILLKYLHELKNDEVAKVLNIPVGTVKSRVNKGLKLLKSYVDKQPDFEWKREVTR